MNESFSKGILGLSKIYLCISTDLQHEFAIFLFDVEKHRFMQGVMLKNTLIGLVLWLVIFLGCKFIPDEPEIISKIDFTVEIIPAQGGTSSLASSYITDLFVSGGDLWVATWGGGISKINSVGTIISYSSSSDGLSSDYCVQVAAGSTSAMASCYDATGNYNLEYFNGVSWVQKNTGTYNKVPITEIVYGNSKYFFLSDARDNNYLSTKPTSYPTATTPSLSLSKTAIYARTSTGDAAGATDLYNQSKVLNGSTGDISLCTNSTASSCATNDTGTCSNATFNSNEAGCISAGATFTNSWSTVKLNRSINAMTIDRDNEVIGVGNFFDDDNNSFSHTPNHSGYEWMHNALFRYKADFSFKTFASANIYPFLFGANWEVPSAIGYIDGTISTTPFERVYIATDNALYQIDLKKYGFNSSISFNLSSGLLSTNIRQFAFEGSNVWMATDKGISLLESGFTSITQSNSELASNNVLSIAYTNGQIYAGTDSGLFIIKRKPKKKK